MATQTTKKKAASKSPTISNIPIGPQAVLNTRGQAVPPGKEDTHGGGCHATSYTGTINLSHKQIIGLYRLRTGLNAASELVEMPSLKGRKEVTSDADAIRWVLERLAELP